MTADSVCKVQFEVYIYTIVRYQEETIFFTQPSVYVYVCVRILGTFELPYLRNYLAENKLLKFIDGLGFYDDLNFLQNGCNRSSLFKF